MHCSLLDNTAMPAALIRETSGQYCVKGDLTEQDIVQAAQAILSQKFAQGDVLHNAKMAHQFFTTQLAALEYEVFCVAFLTTQHQVIACEQMFRGTLSFANVYPREVVKRALALNAASVILAHNHPSGSTNISESDKMTTDALAKALNLVDVQLVDHLVIGGTRVSSFSEMGLL